jgi:prefoldin subunit 5
MPKFACAECGQKIEADESALSGMIHCPACSAEVRWNQTLEIPSSEISPAATLQQRPAYQPPWRAILVVFGLLLLAMLGQLLRLDWKLSQLNRRDDGDDGLITALERVKRSVESIDSNTSDIEPELATLRDGIAQLEAELETMQSGVDAIKDSLGAGGFSFGSGISAKIDAIQSELEEIRSNLRGVGGDVGMTISDVDRNVDEIKDALEIGRYGGGLKGIKSDLNEIKSEINSIKWRLN